MWNSLWTVNQLVLVKNPLFSNNFILNYEIVGFAEGDYEFSFIARDSKGNQSGVFSSEFTTIPERQSKIIKILPQGDFIPKILSPKKSKSHTYFKSSFTRWHNTKH